MNQLVMGRKAAPPALLGIALLSLSLLSSSGCTDNAGNEAEVEQLIPAVEAVQAGYGALPLTQRVSGVVRARNQIEVHPEISALVTEVLVNDGDEVQAGQALVRLRATEFEKRLTQARANHRITVAQLRRAQAQAKEARADYLRLQQLGEESLASDAELESGEAQAESAAAEVELADARVDQAMAGVEEEEENLTRTVVRAPIAGHVGRRDVEPGMLADPGTRLLTLGQLDSVRVEIILTDRMLAEIEEGQRTEIPGKRHPLGAPVAHLAVPEPDLPHHRGRDRPAQSRPEPQTRHVRHRRCVLRRERRGHPGAPECHL